LHKRGKKRTGKGGEGRGWGRYWVNTGGGGNYETIPYCLAGKKKRRFGEEVLTKGELTATAT